MRASPPPWNGCSCFESLMTNVVAVFMSISRAQLTAVVFWYQWKVRARADFIRTYVFRRGCSTNSKRRTHI